MNILLALIIGGAFGAVLDRVGASNPNVIGRMLALVDLRLMKAILLAIGIGSILMFGGQMAGLVEVGHMSVKTTYAGVFVGGLMLGFGWALSGYCPGTGVVAAGAGRRDALAFIAGGLLGAAAYMASYPAWRASGLLEPLLGGKVTLGTVEGANYPGLMPYSGDMVGILVGIAFVVLAFVIPERLTPVSAPVAAE